MKTHPTTFEVLLVDQFGKSEISTLKSLVLGISYSEKLWKNPVISADEASIEDKSAGITLNAAKWTVSNVQSAPAFILAVSGSDFRILETFREKLLAHVVQKLGFGTTRVVTDSISDSISLDIFFLLKKVENATRSFVDKSLIQKEGLNWQGGNGQSTLSFSELSNAVLNKNVLSTPFKNKWNELASLREKVLGNASFRSEEYVLAEQLANDLLKELGSAPVAIEPSRNEPSVQPDRVAPSQPVATAPINGVKQESQPVAVQEKQEAAVEPIIANKVVEEKKEEKPQEVAQPQFQPVEQVKASLEQAHIGTEGNFDLISESMLLQELKTAQSNESGKYVDLKAFVTKMLVPKGYALGPTYMVAKNMDEKGLVKIYETKDEKGFSVRAIRVN